jgi:hypothetical protein
VVAAIAMSLALEAALRPPSASAMAQDTADSLDLTGEWRFDTEEIVRVTHDGGTVRAEFVEGAECLDGQVRPYFLDGVLSGTSLTGNMMVCSRSPRLVEECGISSMYETTFEATVEPGRIAGTRVAQGLATEESGGRYTSCVPDSRYDGTYDFEGHSCTAAERELAELTEQLDAMVAEANAIADELHATPRVPWFDEEYTGPNADQAARAREIGREMLELDIRIDATQDPTERADLEAQVDALAAEGVALEDLLNAMNLTDWTQEDYVGASAELAARWRSLDEEAVALLPKINEAMGRAAECASEECPNPTEGEELLAQLDGMIAELNAIADQLAATRRFPWFDERYTGPNADQASRWREVEQEMLELVARINATQDPAERADLQAQLDALGVEANALEDVLNAMNVTDWTQDDFTGPGAELAARWHALEDESMEVLRQLQEVEQRRRECEEAVG